MEEKRKNAPRTPSLLPLLPARHRPPWPRQSRPTAPRRRDQTPPAREQGHHARCCSSCVARAPAPASYWTPSPSTPWPIKTPSDQTNELTPLTARSRTPSLPPARSRSTQPSTPAKLLDAGGAVAFGLRWASRHRELEEECCRILFRPSPLSPASSTRVAVVIVFLFARSWAPPSPSNTKQTRRWIRIQRQRTGSGDLSHLTSRPHLSVRFKRFPPGSKRYLGRPIRVPSGFGPVQKNSVRFVFIYFPARFELFQICFRYDFQTLIPRVLEIHF
jgi:hypothetical protein